MKPIKLNAIAFAVSAALVSSASMAADPLSTLGTLDSLLGSLTGNSGSAGDGGDGVLAPVPTSDSVPNGGDLAPTPQQQTITYNNVTDVHLVKKLGVEKEMHLKGTVNIGGNINVDSAAIAVSDDKQIIGGGKDDALVNFGPVGINNAVVNLNTDNKAVAGDGDGITSTGNTQLNSAAGDMNIQGNDMSIAVADMGQVFKAGAADAEAFVYQRSSGNIGLNLSIKNDASVKHIDSTGNLHVNSTAGNFNAQKNAFSAAVASGSMAEATAYDKQELNRNLTANIGSLGKDAVVVPVADFFNQGNDTTKVASPATPPQPVWNSAVADNLKLTGNSGINVSAGTNLLQSNKVAISHVNTKPILGQ